MKKQVCHSKYSFWKRPLILAMKSATHSENNRGASIASLFSVLISEYLSLGSSTSPMWDRTRFQQTRGRGRLENGRLKDSAIERIPRQFFIGKEIKNFLPAALPLHHAPLFARGAHTSCGWFVYHDVSREKCKSGHRAGWGPYRLDEAFDPAPEADGGRGARTPCCSAARSRF